MVHRIMPDSREAVGKCYSLYLLPMRETWEWSLNPHSLSSSTSDQSPGLVVKYFSSLIPSLFAFLLANFVLYNSVRQLPRKSLPPPPISTLFNIHLQDGVVCVCNLSPSPPPSCSIYHDPHHSQAMFMQQCPRSHGELSPTTSPTISLLLSIPLFSLQPPFIFRSPCSTESLLSSCFPHSVNFSSSQPSFLNTF